MSNCEHVYKNHVNIEKDIYRVFRDMAKKYVRAVLFGKTITSKENKYLKMLRMAGGGVESYFFKEILRN